MGAPLIEYSLHKVVSGNTIEVDLTNEEGLDIRQGGIPPLFTVLKHSARAHMEERPTSPRHILQSIRTLAAFSKFLAPSGIKWFLSGGVAVDLFKQSSYREHGDIDVVLPISEAPRLRAFLEEKNVGAYRRVCTATYLRDSRLTVFRRVSPSVLDFGNNRTIKLFMRGGDRVLPIIDLHFVNETNEGSQILCDRKIVSLPYTLGCDCSYFVNGVKVELCNLRLMLYMKSDDNPRNFYDAARIAAELPSAEAAHILKLRGRRNVVIPLPIKPQFDSAEAA